MTGQSEEIKHIHLNETDSTNRYLSQYKGEEGRLMTVVTTEFQTEGRGQGKHTWESERGKNLMFSVKMRPTSLPVNRQYLMMQAEALAIYDVLSEYADGFSIKWPNDIYWHDKKISGTLSEASISANKIQSVILGTGININQETFRSDAPNPISLCDITKRRIDRTELLQKILDRLTLYIYNNVEKGDYESIRNEYMRHLYRREGMYRYSDKDGEFTASVDSVLPNGRLRLLRENGTVSEYDFCEVHFIIE